MKGGFHLVCGPDSGGRSSLLSQYVSAPMHISKPWWDDGLLIVNAVNSTAGLFAGDEIETGVEVQSGGQMLLTSPSASRVHRMISGKAKVTQTFNIAAGGWLEFWPALFIPHAGSNYSQETNIRLEQSARCIWMESFAPGRVAHGEAWQFERFENRFNLTYSSRLIARETYWLTPGSASVRALRSQFSNACHASCYAAGTEFPDSVLSEISALHGPDCWVGCTRLDAPAIAIRAVAADNLQLSRALTAVRAILHKAFSRRVPSLRRA